MTVLAWLPSMLPPRGGLPTPPILLWGSPCSRDSAGMAAPHAPQGGFPTSPILPLGSLYSLHSPLGSPILPLGVPYSPIPL